MHIFYIHGKDVYSDIPWKEIIKNEPDQNGIQL
jgi:hypothetical protein